MIPDWVLEATILGLVVLIVWSVFDIMASRRQATKEQDRLVNKNDPRKKR